MTFPLHLLPPEIVNWHLVPLLSSADDILALSEFCNIRVSRELYNRAFHDNTRFSHYDWTMFRERAKARLYLVGDTDEHLDNDTCACPENYEPVFFDMYRRMHTPLRIKSEGIIQQVSIGKDAVYILNSQGQLFLSRMYPQYPKEEDRVPYVMHRVKARRNVEDDYEKGRWDKQKGEREERSKRRTAMDDMEGDEREAERSERDMEESEEEIEVPEEEVEGSEEDESQGESDSDEEMEEDDESEVPSIFINKPLRPSQFIEIHSGYRTIALDSDGLPWMLENHWDPDPYDEPEDQDPFQAYPGRIIDEETDEQFDGRISRVQVGDFLFTCFVENHGVVLLRNESSMATNGFRNGYPCVDENIGLIDVQSIPGTKDIPGDYTVTEFGIIYLNSHGAVCGAPLPENMETNFGADIASLNLLGPFIQLTGTGHSFCLLNGEGLVIDAYIHGLNPFNVTVKTFDLDYPIVSIAHGSDHWLALTQSGEVYCWGKEDHSNGCMGLGRLSEDLKGGDGYRKEGYSLFVDTPTKMKLPGRAYGVFACSTYSGVLVYDE